MLEALRIVQRPLSLRTTFFENCCEHHTWQHTNVARPQPMTARIAMKAAPLCTNLTCPAISAMMRIGLSEKLHTMMTEFFRVGSTIRSSQQPQCMRVSQNPPLSAVRSE